MERKLSKAEIRSYCGNVLPLRLLGGTPYTNEAITWRAEGDAVRLHLFTEDEEPFTDGILVTLMEPGEAKIVCTFEGREYICPVFVHERKRAKSGRHLQYYVGDMHVHTSRDHNAQTFRARTAKDVPARYLEQVRDEGLLDFAVVSDHACVLNGREFFRGYADDEATDPKDLVVFPGSEAEVTYIEEDRYGVRHKNAGEAVTLNTAAYPNVRDWEEFFAQIAQSPFTFSTFAHPQGIGHSTPGIWNFKLNEHATPRFQNLFRLIETGDGSVRGSNLINEYTYSVALDNGFHVSPTCSSDSHGPAWGYYRFPGKTIIMAPEKSKEAFYDAILSNRVYASSSGNVKLYWEVNGHAAPATLPLTDKYRFHVEFDYFHKSKESEIWRLDVISDLGKCVYTAPTNGKNMMDFELESDTAHYFYLRLVDYMHKRTWSCPVWTGREPTVPDATPLAPIGKEGITAVEIESGNDAGVLFCDDPFVPFRASGNVCTIVADLHRTETISAFSHYPRIVTHAELRRDGLIPPMRIAALPSAFRLSTSEDGENYSLQYDGVFRVFGGEEFFRFPETRARYVKLEVLSGCGSDQRLVTHPLTPPIEMAELTFWKKA